MKKYIIITLLLLFGVMFSQKVSAQTICSQQAGGYNGSCSDVASQYNMTMKGFRLRRAGGGGEFVTITSATQLYDFASVNANTSLASYITNATIPVGTYDAVSPILDTNIAVTGSTDLSGGGAPCRTASSGTITDGNPAQSVTFDLSSAPGINAGTDGVQGADTSSDNQYINPDGDFVLLDSTVSGFPITIGTGSSVTFTMSISVASAVNYTYSSGTCTASTPGDLSVNMTATVN